MQLKRVAEAKLPTPLGDFLMVGFEELATGHDHAALVFGDISGKTPVLARVHSECLTGDALFSLRCDCGFQLEAALTHIAGRRTRYSDLPPSGRPQYRPA
ncbi:GTP cyclohydrolase II [Salmonella enterica subsp. enterica serovar Typhimurium str. TN061786]|nr:GTP cyclohydrolase II [Salmonella enterica subsp. enterica serovar Typhimurium str. TN061786]